MLVELVVSQFAAYLAGVEHMVEILIVVVAYHAQHLGIATLPVTVVIKIMLLFRQE